MAYEEKSDVGYPAEADDGDDRIGYPVGVESRTDDTVSTPVNGGDEQDDIPVFPDNRNQSVARKAKGRNYVKNRKVAKTVFIALMIVYTVLLVAASATIPIGLSLELYQWIVLAVLAVLPALFAFLWWADDWLLGFLFGLAGFAVHLCIFFSDLNYSGVSSILFMVSALMLIPITYLQDRYDFIWFIPF